MCRSQQALVCNRLSCSCLRVNDSSAYWSPGFSFTVCQLLCVLLSFVWGRLEVPVVQIQFFFNAVVVCMLRFLKCEKHKLNTNMTQSITQSMTQRKKTTTEKAARYLKRKPMKKKWKRRGYKMTTAETELPVFTFDFENIFAQKTRKIFNSFTPISTFV